MKKIKVLMFMTNLDDLGVQRVVLNLYHNFSDNIEPILVFWYKDGKISEFLKPRGKVYDSSIHIGKPRIITRHLYFRKIILKEKPDVILSFVPWTNLNITFIHKFIPKNITLIACEHAFISKAFSTGEYPGLFGKVYSSMMKYMYNKVFDKLIMSAYVGKKDAIKNWGIKDEKIDIIYNPQEVKNINAVANELYEDSWFDDDIPVIIGAGRLTKQKGFDKLIEAFAIVVKHRKIRLAILGRGELEQELKQQVDNLEISNFVKFYGFQKKHLIFFKKASLFVLSSIWEAMPMVVAEALVVGVPIVAFDCPSGPKELLQNGENGYLVKDQDVDELAKTINFALDNTKITAQKAIQGQKWAEQLDVSNIIKKYEELISSELLRKQNNK